MSENFSSKIRREGLLKDISELPMGTVMDQSQVNIIIPICCREGWSNCPHIPKKAKVSKRNVGL